MANTTTFNPATPSKGFEKKSQVKKDPGASPSTGKQNYPKGRLDATHQDETQTGQSNNRLGAGERPEQLGRAMGDKR